MTDTFHEYEQQYCMLWENLIKKVSSAFVLYGEKKKEKLSEITSDLGSVEKLIWKMDLVASSLAANVKSILLVKLREANSNLKSLKRIIKKITYENVDASTQNDLLRPIMADTKTASADQKSRLSNLTKDLSRTTERLDDNRRLMHETEEFGVSILQRLQSQTRSLQSTQETLHGIDENVKESEAILASMKGTDLFVTIVDVAIVAVAIVAVAIVSVAIVAVAIFAVAIFI
ncbi:PREDICTED: vesicle transport v-SNARE 11-like [Camelina sativa]|uniref:Vesicle transport v-SNARE 11-like n=1 Tax=Camelina sativa TaxID=90675 RepID=A0ABM0U4Y3_CAMSA|nr:PREDICTED: vesicle transport v-SNARE 11-like [Camelina sativa]XP_010435870.1 PREDICTED: vesicle transport v-SNARE 11-like [Camelina sativa]